jgi:hypothetical protein
MLLNHDAAIRRIHEELAMLRELLRGGLPPPRASLPASSTAALPMSSTEPFTMETPEKMLTQQVSVAVRLQAAARDFLARRRLQKAHKQMRDREAALAVVTYAFDAEGCDLDSLDGQLCRSADVSKGAHGVFPVDGVLQLCGDGGRGGAFLLIASGNTLPSASAFHLRPLPPMALARDRRETRSPTWQPAGVQAATLAGAEVSRRSRRRQAARPSGAEAWRSGGCAGARGRDRLEKVTAWEPVGIQFRKSHSFRWTVRSCKSYIVVTLRTEYPRLHICNGPGEV